MIEVREAATWQHIKDNPNGAQTHTLVVPVFSWFAKEAVPQHGKLSVQYVAREFIADEQSVESFMEAMHDQVKPVDVVLQEFMEEFVKNVTPWAIQARIETSLGGLTMTPTATWEHPELRQQPQIMTPPGSGLRSVQ